MTSEEILNSALESGRPCILFLGQDAASTSTRADPVLDLFLARKGVEPESRGGWKDALSLHLSAADLEWLTERFERSVLPEDIQAALDLPWSAVFTSTIDPQLAKRVASRGRQPEAICSADHYPRVPRSTSRPPIYHLFGRTIDRPENARCPSSPNDLARRLARHTSPLLARMTDTATAVGVVIVDGYKPDRDWLPLGNLLGAIPVSDGTQIIWCSADQATRRDPLFMDLLESGTLIAEPRTLSMLVSHMQAHGVMKASALPVLHEPGVISFKGNDFVELTPSLRLRVEASAAIVDDDWTKPAPPISQLKQEELFRRFHGDPGGARLLVEGVVRKFCIERPFETTLKTRVNEVLTRPGERERVVVVHGQSGTGKTVALARLAFVARTELRAPVLLASSRLPEATDIDAFCEVIERAGYGPTLLLCDANLAHDRYYALSSALRSRGRRIVVVGTSYRRDDRTGYRPADFIESPSTATEDERIELAGLLRTFAAVEMSSDAPGFQRDNVFALLYRTIAAGRHRLASGISAEARHAEITLRERARGIHLSRSPSALALQLVAAGLHTGDLSLFETGGDERFGEDAAGRVIDYVMAAGRVDAPVPLNLLMRALRAADERLDYSTIAALFSELDLFRWRQSDDEGSELLVGPRLRLEAELICQRRLGDIGREIDCLVTLIDNVRPLGVDRESELTFLHDLLQKLDRDGVRGHAYSRGYLRIGQALTALRLQHGLCDAGLMLQESNFRRAWLSSYRDDSGVSPEERDRILDDARAVVEDALMRVEARELRAGRRTRENLYVERASIYGFLAVGHAKKSDSAEVLWADYLAARVAVRKAMDIAPTYFPVDVALWIAADVYREAGQVLTASQRAELVVDIHSTLARVDPDDLPPGQTTKYHRRRARVGAIIRDLELQDSALAELAAINPPVAAFLGARRICPEVLEHSGVFDSAVRESARRAAAFLRDRHAAIEDDQRCQRLLLEFEWATETGYRLLQGERRPVPASPDGRRRILGVVKEARALSAETNDFSMAYLEAVLSWVQGDTRDAMVLWRQLGRDTEFEDRRRVVKRLVLSDGGGQPIRFRGRVAEARTQGHWVLDVEGLDGRVELRERDFRGIELSAGLEVREFAIAFNYLGPIADPMTRYEAVR